MAQFRVDSKSENEIVEIVIHYNRRERRRKPTHSRLRLTKTFPLSFSFTGRKAAGETTEREFFMEIDEYKYLFFLEIKIGRSKRFREMTQTEFAQHRNLEKNGSGYTHFNIIIIIRDTNDRS